MIKLPISIKYDSDQRHTATAWLLCGSDPKHWIDELLRCGFDLRSLQFYLLPASSDAECADGVLVVPKTSSKKESANHNSKRERGIGLADASGRDDIESQTPKKPHRVESPSMVGYRVIGERMYVPVSAVLQPPLSDSELQELMSPDVVAYVFHPTRGLIGVETASVLQTRDLLRVPRDVSSDWDAAEPGTKINDRLISIELSEPLDATDVLQQGKGDIGSQSSSMTNLPPAPNEASNNSASKIGRGLTAGMAKAMLWLTQMAPQTATKPTWVNSLESWAASKLAGVGEAIDSIRNKEIRRLLDMLDNNPDEGLKYAISLDGPAHRGPAPPSNYLSQRPVNFSLGGLGGGGYADMWHLDWQHHQRLRARYLELANREVNLGRHRRAAYIYAELLHDLNAAASALKDGGHYREAAALYRDRLNRSLDAAECLEQGGLLGEAIAMFEELGQHERAGDLYRRMGDVDEALSAYRIAADRHATQGDLLAAARVLENKMDEPDEALEALSAGWPDSSQAGGCLQAKFELLARLGRHETAKKQVEQLRDDKYSVSATHFAVSKMADAASSYPSDEVRALAADSCRVVVGRNLPKVSSSQARQLLNSVERLSNEDRLLRRDCRRYGREVEKATPRPKPPPRRDRLGEPKLLTEFKLPYDCQWETVAAAHDVFYAAGYHGNKLRLLRGNWNGKLQVPSEEPWIVEHSHVEAFNKILLAPPSHDVGRVWVSCAIPKKPDPQSFPRSHAFQKSGCIIPAPGEHGTIVAMDRGPTGFGWVALADTDCLMLSSYRPDGALIQSAPIEVRSQELWDWTCGTLMHSRQDEVYFTFGPELMSFDRQSMNVIESFDTPITQLVGTMPHTRTRLAIAFEQGGYVLWPDAVSGGDVQPFGQDLHDCRLCFTKSGALVAVTETSGEIYSTSDGKVELIATLSRPNRKPLAVLPTSHIKQFAVFSETGEVEIYQIP